MSCITGASCAPVDIMDAMPVTATDLPGPILTHDPLHVRDSMVMDPSGFPWGAPDTLPAPGQGSDVNGRLWRGVPPCAVRATSGPVRPPHGSPQPTR